MPRGKPLRNTNGYGSVVKLSGRRRKPYEVRVNTRMDERYYPVYDVLDRFETREVALIALAAITVAEDDQPGVPFTRDELALLRNNQDKPWIDSILIFIYSGWRVSELITMPSKNIDLTTGIFKGGLKTNAGKNRIVPIHSKIFDFVKVRFADQCNTLFLWNGKPINTPNYTKIFKSALSEIGITTYHTPHDCRHTFTSLLDSAGANPVCIDRLVGHASKSLTMKVYTHKDIEELKQAIELI